MQRLVAVLAASLFLVTPVRLAASQGQRADTSFDVSVDRPVYRDTHPLVLFDEGHNNRHGVSSTYGPFARLLENDGYIVRPDSAARFSEERLAGVRVLAIVNAMGPREKRDSPAFGTEEIALVRSWVRQGGSLLIVTDHYPFGDAVAPLAAAFGVQVGRGVVEDSIGFDPASPDHTRLEFSIADGRLGRHPITTGWDGRTAVRRVVTFTGTSLVGDTMAVPLLQLSRGALDLEPHVRVTVEGDQRRTRVSYGNGVPAYGRAQALALRYGRGRVVVIGEAACLTAQIDGDGSPFGMNVPGNDNKQFVRNIMRWLAGG